MQKIACIFSFKMSSWVSCQKIVFNLHKAYSSDSNLELLNFNYSSDQTPQEILASAKAVIAAKPDTIVIMDHKPHPLYILQLILPYLEKKPRVIFHIFGDFTLYYSHWDKLGKFLLGHPVDIVVASERQKDMIDKFLPAGSKSVVCPFPVDKNEFSYKSNLRKAQRGKWGLNENDVAFVFTGRLSRQKRTHTLLKTFNDFLEKSGATNAHLYLYGNVDNVADQFMAKWETEGEYFRFINRIYKSLPAAAQEKIHFMGSVPNSELQSVYQGADMLVNLSVHNDEDYGMSVAEAQCSGLPTIITDWGGLASFSYEEMKEATVFIPVQIGKRAKLIHYDSVVDAFLKVWKNGSGVNRAALSEKALQKFGVERSSRIIREMIKKEPQEFTKFTPFFDKVLSATVFSQTPYMDESRNINQLYREIYNSYVRNP